MFSFDATRKESLQKKSEYLKEIIKGLISAHENKHKEKKLEANTQIVHSHDRSESGFDTNTFGIQPNGNAYLEYHEIYQAEILPDESLSISKKKKNQLPQEYVSVDNQNEKESIMQEIIYRFENDYKKSKSLVKLKDIYRDFEQKFPLPLTNPISYEDIHEFFYKHVNTTVDDDLGHKKELTWQDIFVFIYNHTKQDIRLDEFKKQLLAYALKKLTFIKKEQDRFDEKIFLKFDNAKDGDIIKSIINMHGFKAEIVNTVLSMKIDDYEQLTKTITIQTFESKFPEHKESKSKNHKESKFPEHKASESKDRTDNYVNLDDLYKNFLKINKDKDSKLIPYEDFHAFFYQEIENKTYVKDSSGMIRALTWNDIISFISILKDHRITLDDFRQQLLIYAFQQEDVEQIQTRTHWRFRFNDLQKANIFISIFKMNLNTLQNKTLKPFFEKKGEMGYTKNAHAFFLDDEYYDPLKKAYENELFQKSLAVFNGKWDNLSEQDINSMFIFSKQIHKDRRYPKSPLYEQYQIYIKAESSFFNGNIPNTLSGYKAGIRDRTTASSDSLLNNPQIKSMTGGTINDSSIERHDRNRNEALLANRNGNEALLERIQKRSKDREENALLERIQLIVDAICKETNSGSSYIKVGCFGTKPYYKSEYFNKAARACLDQCKNNNLPEALDAFRVFLTCCMQNKEGNKWHNSKKTKTGELAVNLLNKEDLITTDDKSLANKPYIKNWLLQELTNTPMGSKDAKINYRMLAHGLLSDENKVQNAHDLIFNSKGKDTTKWEVSNATTLTIKQWKK